MSKHPLELKISPLSINKVDAIWGIRLVKAKDEAVLFDAVVNEQDIQSYQTVLSSTPLKYNQQNRAPVFSIKQLLPAIPRWDVIYLDNNSYLGVIERAGGALNRLAFVTNAGSVEPITELYDFESFSMPRFVRGVSSQTNLAITAISNNEELVVFPSRETPEKMKYKKIGSWSDGILLKLASGYVLIAKHTVPGAERYNVLPGILEFVRLDDQLQIIHENIKPLGDQIVYEFDADYLSTASGRGNIVLFATGKDNLLLKISDEAGNWLDTISVEGQFEVFKMARPSVVVIASKEIYVAAIEKMRAPDAQLLVGSVSINP